MAGKGGGAWKLAFADFATAMMAFFLVMWATGQSKPVRAAIAQYFEYPTGTEPQDPSELQRQGNVKPPPPAPLIFYEPDQTQVVGTMVLFEPFSADLNDLAKEQLKALTPHLMGKHNKIEVRGHTSGRRMPAGTKFKDTWEMSYARCLAAKQFLVDQGIHAELIRLSQDAEYEPYSLQFDDKWQDLNSRVEVFVLSELAYKYKERKKETGGYFGPPDADHPALQHGTAEHGQSDHGKSGHGDTGHGTKPSSSHAAPKAHGDAHAPKKDAHGAKPSTSHAAPKSHGDAHAPKKDAHGAKPAPAKQGHH